MTPERWKKIDELLDELLELEPVERAAFLDNACAGDAGLRSELESLLSAHSDSDGFIDTLLAEASAELLAVPKTELLEGRAVSHYQVLGSIGAGGMGEVYLARDTRLGRQVALKLLPCHFTQERTRIRRFQQEACAASALSH